MPARLDFWKIGSNMTGRDLILTSRSGTGLGASNISYFGATPVDIRVTLKFFTRLGHGMNVVKGTKKNHDLDTTDISPSGMITAVNINCFGSSEKMAMTSTLK